MQNECVVSTIRTTNVAKQLSDLLQQNVRDLLNQNGGKQNSTDEVYLYHYTSLKNFVRMISSKTFCFTHGASSKLNDLHERKKGVLEERERLYFACFTLRKDESIAMWYIYGKGKVNTIRIGIPLRVVMRWIENIKGGHPISDKGESPVSAILTTIAYVRGRAKQPMSIFVNGRCVLEEQPHDFDLEIELTGKLKNIAWDYEQECRAIITFDRCAGTKPIAVPFDADMLNSFRLMTGPKFKAHKKMKAILNRNLIAADVGNSICESQFRPDEIKILKWK